MKKHPFFFISCLLLINLISCTDGSDIDHNEQEITTRAKPTKVTICHYNPGNGSYKTRTVNENQVAKHLEHGDYLGACEDAVVCDPECIFDNIASELGYSNACTIEEPPCDPQCLFCEYINLMDFDEPCPEIPFDGDVYCSTFVSAGCPENPEAGSGETYLWDRDLYRNLSPSCGSDDENDSGFIGVSWEIGCDGSLSGQVTVFYDEDGDNVFEIDLIELGATEDDFNKALYCKSIIDNLAADLGYLSTCGD